MEVTLNVASMLEFRRAGHDMKVDMETIPPHIMAELIGHGLTQTVGDAASAASGTHYEANKGKNDPEWKKLAAAQKRAWTEQHATEIAAVGAALMAKRLEALQRGEWTAPRAAAAGLSELETRIADLVAAQMTFPKGSTKRDKAKAGWDAYGKQSDAVKDHFATVARDQLEAERRTAQAAQAVKLDLTGL